MSRSFTLVTRTEAEIIYTPFTHQDISQQAIMSILMQYPDALWIVDKETGSLMYSPTK